ncbi:hypothetical protein [Nitrincola sp. MINF-07-Sa-05]|uniref:hypothetical protein n=1 Tax=Nitrincola salilacus TaxID=3400273 RepID=UPI00391810CE
MEMRITISGLGLALGKTGFGANLVSGAYLQTRSAKCGTVNTFGLTKGLSLGSSSGTVVFGHVQTEWFRIDENSAEFFDNDSSVGKVADVNISGAIVAGGRVDVNVDLIDENGSIETLVTKANISSSGIQISSTKVRGILKKMPRAQCVTALPSN